MGSEGGGVCTKPLMGVQTNGIEGWELCKDTWVETYPFDPAELSACRIISGISNLFLPFTGSVLWVTRNSPRQEKEKGGNNGTQRL